MTLFEFLSVVVVVSVSPSCRGLKNPSSVLHSRIVTVSRFTVTSVMKMRSVVACTRGSQSFGFADLGDASSFTFEFCMRLVILFSLLLVLDDVVDVAVVAVVCISPVFVVDLSGVRGSISVLITILLLSGISFAVLIVVGLVRLADDDDDDEEEHDESEFCCSCFSFSFSRRCSASPMLPDCSGTFTDDEDDEDSVAESCDSSTFTTIGCGTMIDFFVSMMIFGDSRGFAMVVVGVFLMVMPILPDSFESTSALRLAPIGRSSLLLLSLLDVPASSRCTVLILFGVGMMSLGMGATCAAAGDVLCVALEPFVATVGIVTVILGLEFSSFFFSLSLSSSSDCG